MGPRIREESGTHSASWSGGTSMTKWLLWWCPWSMAARQAPSFALFKLKRAFFLGRLVILNPLLLHPTPYYSITPSHHGHGHGAPHRSPMLTYHVSRVTKQSPRLDSTSRPPDATKCDKFHRAVPFVPPYHTLQPTPPTRASLRPLVLAAVGRRRRRWNGRVPAGRREGRGVAHTPEGHGQRHKVGPLGVPVCWASAASVELGWVNFIRGWVSA